MGKTVVVSGGFDPVHVGHLRMMQEAAKHGELIVVINSDPWLMRKKGFIFMPFPERAEIISAFECVSRVEVALDSDNTVCQSLRVLKPDIFANGGDRTPGRVPEEDVCEELGIEMMWGVGGGKIRSSSTLVSDVTDKKRKRDLAHFRETHAV